MNCFRDLEEIIKSNVGSIITYSYIDYNGKNVKKGIQKIKYGSKEKEELKKYKDFKILIEKYDGMIVIKIYNSRDDITYNNGINITAIIDTD